MQKQMIITVPDELINDMSEMSREYIDSIFLACESFLKGETPVIMLPESIKYDIKDAEGDISEVVLRIEGEYK